MEDSRKFAKVVSEQLGVKLKYISAGAFGSVYKISGKNLVVKLGGTFVSPEGSSEYHGDDAYLHFLKEACKHQTNPFFPKIKEATIYQNGNYAYAYYVVMERLTEFSYRRTNRVTQKMADLLLDNDAIEIASLTSLFANIDPKLKKSSPFVSALSVLNKLFEDHDEDLHGGNIMLRGKQLVITDPIA